MKSIKIDFNSLFRRHLVENQNNIDEEDEEFKECDEARTTESGQVIGCRLNISSQELVVDNNIDC